MLNRIETRFLLFLSIFDVLLRPEAISSCFFLNLKPSNMNLPLWRNKEPVNSRITERSDQHATEEAEDCYQTERVGS